MLIEPSDARLVDVASPDVGLGGLSCKMSECPSRTAAEVQDPPSRERPVGGEAGNYVGVRSAANFVVVLHRLARGLERPHSIRQFQWRIGEGPVDHRREPSL